MLDWPSPPRLGAVIREATRQLSGSPSAQLDARVLAKHAFAIDDVGLITDEARTVDPDALARFDAMIVRRRESEPVAYIIGSREFWSLDLAMAPGVLVPRADSETLIEAIVARRAADAPLRIVDLGCGSGALLCALLSSFPNATGLGVDINYEAAALTLRNLSRLGLGDRADVIVGSWNAALCGRFDVLISNPPYIPLAQRSALAPDVRNFEDSRALFAGADGLDAYKAILALAPGLLRDAGLVALEVGDGQAAALESLAKAAFSGVTPVICNDLRGRPRGLILNLASDENNHCNMRSGG